MGGRTILKIVSAHSKRAQTLFGAFAVTSKDFYDQTLVIIGRRNYTGYNTVPLFGCTTMFIHMGGVLCYLIPDGQLNNLHFLQADAFSKFQLQEHSKELFATAFQTTETRSTAQDDTSKLTPNRVNRAHWPTMDRLGRFEMTPARDPKH